MIIKWHPCPGHPNYQINRLAQVRSVKTGKLLTPYDDGSGYLRVKLDGMNCRLHILVALAFIPNPDNKPVVNPPPPPRTRSRVDYTGGGVNNRGR